MKNILAFLFVAFLFTACKGQSADIATIPAKDFAQKLGATPNAQLIDVRTPTEYQSGHIDNSRNIDWNGESFAAQAEKLDREKPVFVYCRAGTRSHKAAEKLHEMGFKQIYDLQGGMTQWTAEGLPQSNQK